MADISVPGVLKSLRTQLLTRPPLAGVRVSIVDRPANAWTDAEAIVLSRVTMTGARWLGWGAGPQSKATVEPLNLSGYAFAKVAGSSAESEAAAWQRVGVFVGEIAQQLRDDPTVGGDLSPTTRYQAPIMSSALWGAWPGDQDGVAIIRIRADFTVTWQAIS